MPFPAVAMCDSDTHHRVGPSTTITHVGLPRAYDSFGRKRAMVHYLNFPIDVVDYEVFFDKYGNNHPGGAQGCPPNHGNHPTGSLCSPSLRQPNWVFFYVQRNAPVTPWWYVPMPGFHDDAETRPRYGDWAVAKMFHGQPFETFIRYFPPGADDEVYQMHLFTGLTAHENRHDSYFRQDLWQNLPNYTRSLDGDCETTALVDCNESGAPAPSLDAIGCPVVFGPGQGVISRHCWLCKSERAAWEAGRSHCHAVREVEQHLDWAWPGPNSAGGSLDPCFGGWWVPECDQWIDPEDGEGE